MSEIELLNMLLFCPRCHLQHVDEVSADWSNPPHRSHLCHGCGCIWRPADVPTNGVLEIQTIGKADNWYTSGTTPEPAPKLAATLNKSPDNFKAGAEVSSFVQSDAAVIERAASEAIVLIDEINKHAPSRRFNGINQPLHRKLATIRATLARALRSALDAREGG